MTAVDTTIRANAILNAYAGGDIDLTKLDLETAMSVVMINRTKALDGVLNQQMQDMQQRNNQIKALNKLNELLRVGGNAVTDANSASWSNVWNSGGDGVIFNQTGLMDVEKVGAQTRYVPKTDMYAVAKEAGLDVSKYFDFKEQRNAGDIKFGYYALKTGTIDGKAEKDGGKTFGEALRESIGDVIKDLTNEAQLEQIKLQSMMNKRSQAYELLSNLTSKFDSGRDKIIGNIR